MAVLDYPVVNSLVPDWSSVELRWEGYTLKGIKSVAYNEKLDGQIVRGAGVVPMGTTRGQYEAGGSIEVYKESSLKMRKALGSGWGEKYCRTVVQYKEKNSAAGLIKDELFGCRLKVRDASHSQGNDPLVEKFDLLIMYIVGNGMTMFRSQADAINGGLGQSVDFVQNVLGGL